MIGEIILFVLNVWFVAALFTGIVLTPFIMTVVFFKETKEESNDRRGFDTNEEKGIFTRGYDVLTRYMIYGLTSPVDWFHIMMGVSIFWLDIAYYSEPITVTRWLAYKLVLPVFGAIWFFTVFIPAFFWGASFMFVTVLYMSWVNMKERKEERIQ